MIRVSPEVSKTGTERLVELNETLRAWLSAYPGLQGSIRPANARKLLDAARECAGIEEWPNNAFRHSFASYFLADCQDSGRTAEQLGHPNPRMLYKHYRAVVTPSTAARY